jgi:hypothetical protein
MNVIGWLLAISGSVAFLAAGVGIVYVLFRPEALVLSSETSLHDSYYVTTHVRAFILPLVLSMVLSASIALIGYSQTDQFVSRMFRPPTHQSGEP